MKNEIDIRQVFGGRGYGAAEKPHKMLHAIVRGWLALTAVIAGWLVFGLLVVWLQ